MENAFSVEPTGGAAAYSVSGPFYLYVPWGRAGDGGRTGSGWGAPSAHVDVRGAHLGPVWCLLTDATAHIQHRAGSEQLLYR